jgi:hypothetical protein
MGLGVGVVWGEGMKGCAGRVAMVFEGLRKSLLAKSFGSCRVARVFVRPHCK